MSIELNSKDLKHVNDKHDTRKLVYPLLSGSHGIRILDLCPAQDEDDIIICSLLPLDLQVAQVSYEALSYTWGDLSFSERIICNGLDFSVTLNLISALHTLRSSTKHRYLWIGQICID